MNLDAGLACPKCLFESSTETQKCEFCGWQLLDEDGNQTIFEGFPLEQLGHTEGTDTSFEEQITQITPYSQSNIPTFQRHSDGSHSFNLTGELAHFEVQKVVGKGGMGAVYRATDQTLERDVAIKVLRQSKGLDQAGKDLLLKEARTICKLNHPNIVTVFDVARSKNNNYIIMEWIEGETLDKLIPAEGLELNTALSYATKIVNGLVCAHQNQIIHSDIKPQNIMLTRNGDIKILDFGIAALVQQQVDYSANQLQQEGKSKRFNGTPGYISPEQALGNKQLDSRSDIFAFGIVFYQLLTGKAPFLGKNARDKNAAIITGDYQPLPSHIPIDVRAIVYQCLKHSPLERYQSSTELAQDIQCYLAGDTVSVVKDKSYWLKKKTLKHKWPVLFLLVVLLGSSGQLVWQQIQKAEQAQREELLTQFTSRVETLEARVQMSKMAPIHDKSAETERWHNEIESLKNEISLLGNIAIGPGNNAIGRMYYALQEYDNALKFLQLAWNSGFTEPEVAYNLAVTHGAIYQRQKNIIANLGSRSARQDRMAVLDKQHKQPAIEYLTQGMHKSPYQPYTKALLEYYQGDFDKALNSLNALEQLPVWFYDHHVLAGDIHLAKAEAAGSAHGDKQVEDNGQLALSYYQKAAELGRSDLQLQLKPLAVYFRLLTDALYSDQQAFKQIYNEAMAFVDNAMLIAPKDHQPYFIKGQLLLKLSDYQDQASGDPLEAVENAINQLQMARKVSNDNADILFALSLANYQRIKLLVDREMPLENKLDQAVTSFENIPLQTRDYFYFNTYGGLLTSIAVEKAKLGIEAQLRNSPHAATDDHGDYFQSAVTAYQNAIQRKPERIGAKINRASAYLEWSSYSELEQAYEKLLLSINSYEEALALNPEHFVVNYYLGAAHRWMAKLNNQLFQSVTENIESAKAYFSAAEKEQPQHPFLHGEKALLQLDLAIYAWQEGKAYQAYLEQSKSILNASLENNSDNRVLIDNLVLVHQVEQQLRHFFGTKNTEQLHQALNISKTRIGYGKQEYILMQLLNNNWQSIEQEEVGSLPINAEALIARAEWYSQAGLSRQTEYFQQAESVFGLVKQYYPALLWHYQLQHLNRWESSTELSDAQKANLKKQKQELEALLKEHYPAIYSSGGQINYATTLE